MHAAPDQHQSKSVVLQAVRLSSRDQQLRNPTDRPTCSQTTSLQTRKDVELKCYITPFCRAVGLET